MDYAIADLGIRYAGHPRGAMDWGADEMIERLAHWVMERSK